MYKIDYPDRIITVLRQRDISKNKLFLYFVSHKKNSRNKPAMMWYKSIYGDAIIFNILGLKFGKNSVGYEFGTANHYFFKERKRK